jgi:hypothetical protein
MKQAVNGFHPRLKILVAKGQTFIFEGKPLMVLFKVNDDKIYFFSGDFLRRDKRASLI